MGGLMKGTRRILLRPRGGAAMAWWDPDGDGLSVWAAYQAKGAASYAESLTDLSGNGNDASTGVQPGWDAANGWKFNGSTHYLTTTFVPQNDQSQTALIQFTTLTNTGVIFGIISDASAADRMQLRPSDGFNVVYRNGNANKQVAPNIATGNLCIAGSQGYRNGAADGGAIAGWAGGAPSRALWIGVSNNGAGGTLFCAAYVQAFALYDETLTAGQVAAVAAAMATLPTEYTLTAATGALSLAGQAATFAVARTLAAAAGTLSFAGQSAALSVGRTLAAAVGTLTLTSQDTTFTYYPATPTERTYAIPAETRTMAIDSETRTYAIAQESRVYAVGG